MRLSKKILSMVLAIVMVLGLLPATAAATGENNVYISVSFDGQYINDKTGSPIVYVPVSFDQIASIDLEAYGLGDYLYDPDGDGAYEITALQLIIYVHENIYTDNKDKYQTDPVPEGKPKPVEPEDQNVDKNQTLTCTFSIECSTILNNLDQLDSDKLEMVPSNGVILTRTTVTFYEGESVFDVLQRVCREYGIHMEASWTPIYNSAYVEGIHNLYEFDCGALSGWMYSVNGWYPNYGSSRYQLKDGDVVQWRYTCDLGNDIGGGYAVGG